MEHSKPSVTYPMPANEIIDSGYGRITAEEWCEREVARVRSKGDQTMRVWRKKEMVGLTRYGKTQQTFRRPVAGEGEEATCSAMCSA